MINIKNFPRVIRNALIKFYKDKHEPPNKIEEDLVGQILKLLCFGF